MKDDIKATIVKGETKDDDLQHILLDIGFGKGRHYLDIYYREWKSCVTKKDDNEYHINSME